MRFIWVNLQLLNLLLHLRWSYLVFLQLTLSLFHDSFPSRIKKKKNGPAAKVWVFIAQLVEHCSNLVEGSGGWWLVFVECASVKCHRNISSCINTTFLDFLQPLHAVIDFNLRLRILVTMFRINRLCPPVISILKVWKSLSLRLMWSPLSEKQAHNSTDRDQFLRKIPQNVFSLPTKSCVHA